MSIKDAAQLLLYSTPYGVSLALQNELRSLDFKGRLQHESRRYTENLEVTFANCRTLLNTTISQVLDLKDKVL